MPILAMVAFLAAGTALAADVGWRDRNGQPVPETEAQRSVSGFGGWLLVTSDKDWEEKWSTPSEVTPTYTTAEDLHVGSQVAILILFVNARADTKGDVRVLCDLRVTRPNRTVSVDVKNADCYTGPLQGDPYSLRMTTQYLVFKGESTDPLGTYIVDVKLHDKTAKISVPLRTHFVLLK
jgi:hypothetical protein